MVTTLRIQIIITIFSITTPLYAKSQIFNTVSCNFQTKTVFDSTHKQLIKGKIYYNKKTNTIVKEIFFPKKQTLITTDSVSLIIENNKIAGKNKTQYIPRLSVLKIALDGNLNNYNLDKIGFTLRKTEKQDGLIISKWEKTANGITQNINIATQNNKLYAMIIFDEKQKVLSKTFFENYINIKGLIIPQQITEIIYDNEKEIITRTNYSDIHINSMFPDIYDQYLNGTTNTNK